MAFRIERLEKDNVAKSKAHPYFNYWTRELLSYFVYKSRHSGQFRLGYRNTKYFCGFPGSDYEGCRLQRIPATANDRKRCRSVSRQAPRSSESQGMRHLPQRLARLVGARS